MTAARRSAQPISRITCPACGFEQPLSMDCAGCRRSFSLDELEVLRPAQGQPARPAQVEQASVAAGPTSPGDPFGGGSVFADRPEPVHPEPPPPPPDLPPLSAEPGMPGDIYDPETAVHSTQSRSRFSGATRPDLSAGALVSEAVQAAMLNFLPVGLVTLIVTIPGLLYTAYFIDMASPDPTAGGVDWQILGLHFIGLVVMAQLGQLLGAGALAHVVGRWMRDETVVLTESLGIALRALPLLVPLVIVQSIGTFLGFLLFLIPGIVLMAAWAVSVPALVIERLGVMEALGRSWDLTTENRTAILFAFFILGLMNTLLSWLLSLVLGPGNPVVDYIVPMIFTAVHAVLSALIYFKLKASADGVNIDRVSLGPNGG